MTDFLRKNSEEVLASLRELYGRSGYSRYKMNKFEEYDLYAGNKDFLISDSVITFTDGNGKLLALKPDVTLSIVKNSKAGRDGVEKLYYNENVYRVTKGSRNYKEIMQVGLECIGDVDGYCIYEVLKLALESLGEISGECVLGVSHLGILSEVIDSLGIPADARDDVLKCVGEKNLHELSSILGGLGVAEEKANVLKELVRVNGGTAEVLGTIGGLLGGVVSEKTLADFTSVMASLAGEKSLKIDFSVVSDMRYYNGFVFKGYVREVPQSVLSGGQYDRLMKKMGKTASAIGFAVYLDLIDQYSRSGETYDVDTVLLYGENSTPSEIGAAADELRGNGDSVLAAKAIPDGLRYKKLVKFENGRVGENG